MSTKALKTGISTHLRGNAAISNLVSNRVYKVVSPQNETFPYIAFQKIAGERDETHNRLSGFQKQTFEITAWSRDSSEADDIGDAIVEAMVGDGYSQSLGSFVTQGILHTDESDKWELLGEGSESLIFGSTQEFEIHFSTKDQS